jgi:hypothetical protein
MGSTPLQRKYVCFAAVLALCVLGDCKKTRDEAPPPPPVPSAVPGPTEATAEVPAPVQPSAVQPAAKPMDHSAEAAAVKACCAALRKEAEGASGAAKGSYEGAAKSCDSIADLVKKGVTQKGAGLTQIRAALRGGSLPAGCR